jgi:hypothetical protein
MFKLTSTWLLRKDNAVQRAEWAAIPARDQYRPALHGLYKVYLEGTVNPYSACASEISLLVAVWSCMLTEWSNDRLTQSPSLSLTVDSISWSKLPETHPSTSISRSLHGIYVWSFSVIKLSARAFVVVMCIQSISLSLSGTNHNAASVCSHVRVTYSFPSSSYCDV